MAEGIESLKRRKADLTAQREDIKKRIHYDKSQVDSLNSRISALKNKMNNGTKELTVSDHAMLRFLERQCDIDVDVMKQTIVTTLEPFTKTLGDGQFSLNDSLTAIIKGNVVVTVMTKGE